MFLASVEELEGSRPGSSLEVDSVSRFIHGEEAACVIVLAGESERDHVMKDRGVLMAIRVGVEPAAIRNVVTDGDVDAVTAGIEFESLFRGESLGEVAMSMDRDREFSGGRVDRFIPEEVEIAVELARFRFGIGEEIRLSENEATANELTLGLGRSEEVEPVLAYRLTGGGVERVRIIRDSVAFDVLGDLIGRGAIVGQQGTLVRPVAGGASRRRLPNLAVRLHRSSLNSNSERLDWRVFAIGRANPYLLAMSQPEPILDPSSDFANAPTSEPIAKPHKDDTTPTFGFGQNWSDFLEHLTDERIDTARRSLQEFLQVERLDGLSFLDIGCGSGLFSYAAHQLGATCIESFDVDSFSVQCCTHMREKAGNPSGWNIAHGSVLDDAFVAGHEKFDVVYAWGCLHHSGHMWKAIENAASRVAPGGRFYLAIYGDRRHGVMTSKNWLRVKRLYNRMPDRGRTVMTWIYGAGLLASKVVRLKNPVRYVREYKRNRGMSWQHDLVDWIGGYPYEYAGVQELFAFLREKNPDFYLANLHTSKGLGNHELLFARLPQD